MKKKTKMLMILVFVIIASVFFAKDNIFIFNIPKSIKSVNKVWREQTKYNIKEVSEISYEEILKSYDEKYMLSIEVQDSKSSFVMIAFNSEDEARKAYSKMRSYKNKLNIGGLELDLEFKEFNYHSFKIGNKHIYIWRKSNNIIYIDSESKKSAKEIKKFMLSQKWK